VPSGMYLTLLHHCCALCLILTLVLHRSHQRRGTRRDYVRGGGLSPSGLAQRAGAAEQGNGGNPGVSSGAIRYARRTFIHSTLLSTINLGCGRNPVCYILFLTSYALCCTGLLEDLLVSVRKTQEALQRCLEGEAQGSASAPMSPLQPQMGTSALTSGSSRSGKDSGGAGRRAPEVTALVCRAVGALHACNTAVLALAQARVFAHLIPVSVPTPVTLPSVKCALCSGSNSKGQPDKDAPGNQGMLRCSRCKAVHYCCKEHQAQHWPKHKVGCFTYFPIVNVDLVAFLLSH
jgi:hypothetical protein